MHQPTELTFIGVRLLGANVYPWYVCARGLLAAWTYMRQDLYATYINFFFKKIFVKYFSQNVFKKNKHFAYNFSSKTFHTSAIV